MPPLSPDNLTARDHQSESLAQPHEEGPTVARKLHIATDLTLQQATDLLDWLEVHGMQPRDVMTTQAGYLTIRWLERPA